MKISKKRNLVDPPPEERVALLLRLREGNHEAFEAIYDRYYGVARMYAQKLVCEENSHDVTMIAFSKVWEKRERFKTWPHLIGFIYKATRNACLTWLRKEKNENKKRKHYSKHLLTRDNDNNQDIHDQV